MKSELFKAEEEYRAVFRCPDNKQRKYRTAHERFVPYIEIPIAKKGMKNIRQITLAPLNRSELDIRGMNVFCDVNGLENVKVVTSNLKLRF